MTMRAGRMRAVFALGLARVARGATVSFNVHLSDAWNPLCRLLEIV
jgi:hypothetical protein